jgi:hypothetical protein
LEDLEKIPKFLDTSDLSNLKPEDIKNLRKAIMINKFKAVIDSQKRNV